MDQSMQNFLSGAKQSFVQGSIVRGRVVEIRSTEVIVDIGYKSEGAIPADEFEDLASVKAGDEIEVLLEKLEDEEGIVVLSRNKAEQKKNWEKILTACEEGSMVTGKVKSKIRGGLLVNIGVDAFLPASQIDVQPVRNLDDWLGKTLEFKVIKINSDRKNIVLSRRELLEEQRVGKRRKILADLKVGQTCKGIVKNITDFGAFVDLDGLDGLLHITDMSWTRIGHPSEIMKVSDTIEVVILDINREKERVSLGLKQRQKNPWEMIRDQFPIGTRVKGKVTNLVPFGAFMEIEKGIEGLIHISEFSWTKRVTKPQEVLSIGDIVEAVVLGVQPEEKKISLGLRQLEANPWQNARDQFPVGSRVKAEVRNLTGFGAFVELPGGLDGLIHVSDMSWTRKINNPSEILKKGDQVEVVILEVDAAQQRIALGLKQLSPDPWANIEQRHKIGDTVRGKVTKLANFGAFVELAPEIEGLVHISQISEERIEKIKDVLKIGDEISARILKIDAANRRISLSIKAANYPIESLQEEESKVEAALQPGEDIVALHHAFNEAEDRKR